MHLSLEGVASMQTPLHRMACERRNQLEPFLSIPGRVLRHIASRTELREVSDVSTCCV